MSARAVVVGAGIGGWPRRPACAVMRATPERARTRELDRMLGTG
jgi:hypothetical protein